MRTSCPAPTELLLAALDARDARVGDPAARHVRDCPSCLRQLERLREVVQALRSTLPEPLPSGACLDDLDIAALVDGIDPKANHVAIAHLAACAACTEQLAAVTRLLRDPLVIAELERLEPAQSKLKRPGRRVSYSAIAAGLAAAVLAGVIFWPQVSRRAVKGGDDAVILRERAITTTAGPRILGPVGMALPVDSLRWTSVPRADLYRVTVWDREGRVVWEGQTRDSVIALPIELSRIRETALLWDVKARTGWDRWVASDLVEFTIRDSEGIE